jgi:hypothetical protein
MKSILFYLVIFTFSLQGFSQTQWSGPSADFGRGKLKVSENKRFLIFDDGTPFFYLGDTGWELFHRLTPDEVETYLENRRSKGFTVIQAVILAELDGLNTPNMLGEKPFFNNNPATPNEAYFKHVDWVLKKAEAKGLFIGLLPTWGDKVDKQWGKGPVIFNSENAFLYGQWLGKRYASYPNIIWINGGDREGGGANFAVWDALGKGIKSVDKNHLMTYHPWGEKSSANWFQESDWLDFNMMQTGHGQRTFSIYKILMIPGYQKNPVKPILDGEPRYEDHPVGWRPEELGWFNQFDVRQAVYQSVFCGGFGVTYGCHPIWQFMTPGREPIGLVRHNWNEVLDLPGASQMIHLRKLMESRDFLSRYPAQDLVLNPDMPDNEYIVATKGKGYVFIYTPGPAIMVNLDLIGAKELNAWWFNPRTGESKLIETLPGTGIKKYIPSEQGNGNDWVLVLDETSANYPAPGKNK